MTGAPPARFQDDQACLCAFTGTDVHVVCPACCDRAVVAPIERLAGSPRWWPRRLVCTRCTYTLNAAHLDVLERFVGADLRERGAVPGTLSMVESLPAWMTHAGHRDDVLRGIRRLRARPAAVPRPEPASARRRQR
jgi:hypothetical protein